MMMMLMVVIVSIAIMLMMMEMKCMLSCYKFDVILSTHKNACAENIQFNGNMLLIIMMCLTILFVAKVSKSGADNIHFYGQPDKARVWESFQRTLRRTGEDGDMMVMMILIIITIINHGDCDGLQLREDIC